MSCLSWDITKITVKAVGNHLVRMKAWEATKLKVITDDNFLRLQLYKLIIKFSKPLTYHLSGKEAWELFKLVLFRVFSISLVFVIMSLHGYSDGEYDDGSDVDNVTLISKLDVSHPLHLHPNDSVALTVVFVKLKGTENYQVWCTCHAADDFKKHNQLMKLMQFLMGLDDTYMQIRSSILSRDTLPDVRSAYAIISNEEKAGSNFKGKNVSNNVVGSSSSNGFSDEQMATFILLIKENSVNGKGVHSNMTGTYMNSSTVVNKNFEKFFCSNSSLHSKLVSKGLITDSGANQHITYTDKNLINVIDISYLKIKVTHPNGTEAFITRIRNMPLTDYLTLYDVLVVPEYCVSLMSVHKVARDSKLVIAFDEMHCYVMNQDLRKGKILGTGKQIGGLYYFDGNQAIPFNKMELLRGNIDTFLILPTSVLNGKSPYDLVYNKPSPLKHLRSFGCLAYATILNSHDKFGSRSEKCVLVGYSNSKKGYKLSSLDNKQVIYSRQGSKSTFAFSNENDAGHSQDADASASESFATDEVKNSSSEGNDLHDQTQDNVSQDNNGVQNLRRSSRTSVFPKNINDFIVDSKVKYGLEKNNTWEIVDLPIRRKAIGSKWVWKIKYKPNGEIERYKARVVAKAFNQREGIDRADEISSRERVLLLRLVTVRSLLVYVDDIIIIGNSLAEIKKVKQFLKTKFMIKDLGKLKYFLGIEVLDTPKGICLNQRKYCLKLIDEFRLLAGKPSNLPMQPNISLTSEPSDTDPLLDNVTEYQKLIAKLIYLTTTRPDIAYTVSCLSQFMHNPFKSHLKTTLKVIRYLKGSPGKGINVIKGSVSSIDLKAYSDADWARCADTRRSITGYCVFMCSSLVSWKSTNQNTISKSSIEA
ncbi:ribonuclease H-like domain-containing protein [Tanacetum coccineum]